ncbi:bifunctional alpha/beta hydrolase/class I SAM-dependent methyltransferase [Inhella proteolytica]|uniref:Bifunctional alpha/beta hydrolase/class I SAM-dependent methyltransferase n=1 Tax=Inhella proteolytica TaxID=2795029 RepID=A0A931NK37_9BURK|nr:bifunctional alpha/beta hydrolase/class I SAM-dependent methyltransferase [Inhella proteolytica]MBH9579290.1 bifunctional alpha/beta hydrolase/class I SAM-dependent methyltransferase [Inhella proteolytica]
MDYPTTRPEHPGQFQTHDGQSLFYRHWPAQGPRQGALLLLHRGHEHSGRMAHLADELNLPGFDVFAWDARGHGRSPGARGYSPGVACSVRDLQDFVQHLQQAHGVAASELVVVAQSVGAVLAATWVHDYAPPLRGLVLAAPAFKVKLYVPFARPGLRLLQKLRGEFFVTSYVQASQLSQDAQRVASYQADPLITRPIAVGMLLGLYEAAERVVADAAAIQVPTQLLVAGRDWVVHEKPQRRFFERLGSPVKELRVLDGFRHDLLGERERERALAEVRRFVLARFAAPLQPPCLRRADRQGPSHAEALALAQPLPLASPRGAWWALVRANLRLGAWLSEGLRLGRRTGFDSGSTLDYVYRNQPQGRSGLGRLIDRVYLNSIGWRGIRQRKRHVEELLRQAMARLQGQGEGVRLLDVAAGHGRYVLDALEALPAQPRPEAVLLRDYSALNVQAGTELIRTRGLQDIARFEQADAFDPASLAQAQPRPNLAVVSGLYELFPCNEQVGRSLAGIAQAVPPGGYLVYTGQPWHPQLELIARALTSHRQGQAWVMRRRSQAEMDQLVREAGFEKLDQRVDEWGIFTVALARRVAA